MVKLLLLVFLVGTSIALPRENAEKLGVNQGNEKAANNGGLVKPDKPITGPFPAVPQAHRTARSPQQNQQYAAPPRSVPFPIPFRIVREASPQDGTPPPGVQVQPTRPVPLPTPSGQRPEPIKPVPVRQTRDTPPEPGHLAGPQVQPIRPVPIPQPTGPKPAAIKPVTPKQ